MQTQSLFIHQFELGPMENFIYLIGPSQSEEVYVVDPGWNANTIIKTASQLNKKIVGALCSHSHPDHINAVEALLQTHDIPVYMLDKEIHFTSWRCENLTSISNGDQLKVGDITLNVLHTPGHTVGSTCYKIGPYLVSGDTLFINGCGRCDRLDGDPVVMYDTLKKLINTLPQDTIILPGHNYGNAAQDTLGEQRKTNPYLKHDTLESFLQHRMGLKNFI